MTKLVVAIAIATIIAVGLIWFVPKQSATSEQPGAAPISSLISSTSPALTPTSAFSPQIACGPILREYRNSRYGYEIKAPVDWRLATKIVQAVNIGVPMENAEFVYFTKLNCEDELRISAAVPQSDSLSEGLAVTDEVDQGNIFVVFANTTDAGLNFAHSASRTMFHNTTVAPVQNVTTELLDSGVSAVKYELRRSADAPPLATIFVPDISNPPNSFGQRVMGFTIQTGLDASDEAFSTFYRSFKYFR